MRKKRKRRFVNSYSAVKSHQHISRRQLERVSSWEIDELVIDKTCHVVNRRKRSRIGFVQYKGRNST